MLQVKTKATLKHAKQQWDTCHNLSQLQRLEQNQQKPSQTKDYRLRFNYQYREQELAETPTRNFASPAGIIAALLSNKI